MKTAVRTQEFCWHNPFSGSNVVGEVAERQERQWISAEINEKYVVGSAFRFDGLGEIAYQKHMEHL
jgi:DNA modification methylase